VFIFHSTFVHINFFLNVHAVPGRDIFSSAPRPDRLWGLPSLLSSGYQGALIPCVKRLGREADRLNSVPN